MKIGNLAEYIAYGPVPIVLSRSHACQQYAPGFGLLVDILYNRGRPVAVIPVLKRVLVIVMALVGHKKRSASIHSVLVALFNFVFFSIEELALKLHWFTQTCTTYHFSGP
jgi:hypothetical protein